MGRVWLWQFRVSVKALLHCAIFRATCLATPSRNKSHETLHNVGIGWKRCETCCSLQPLQKVKLGSTNATISTDFPQCVARQVAWKIAQCNSEIRLQILIIINQVNFLRKWSAYHEPCFNSPVIGSRTKTVKYGNYFVLASYLHSFSFAHSSRFKRISSYSNFAAANASRQISALPRPLK